MLRRFVKAGLAWGLHGAGADEPLGQIMGRRAQPLVLGYHRVTGDGAAEPPNALPGMAITRGMLERHLDWVGRRHRFVSLDELGAALERREPFRQPVAAVTFDDGYADVFENAFPLLVRKGIPAAFFVVTDWIGTRGHLVYDRLYLLLEKARAGGPPRQVRARAALHGLATSIAAPRPLLWPDEPSYATLRWLLHSAPQARLLRLAEELDADDGFDERALSALLPMTWEMVGALVRSGMTVGSHTRTHALLTREEPARVRSELAGSRACLESRLGGRVAHFAYPDGDADESTVDAVAAAGYRFAYLACGHRDQTRPLLTQPRLLLWQESCAGPRGEFAPAILSCQLNGVFPGTAGCADAHWRRGQARLRAGSA